MKRYVENWGEVIEGLVGSQEEITAAMKSFRLEAQKIEIRSEEDYQMDHPTLIYLMDKEGRFIKTLSSSAKAQVLAKEIGLELN